MSAPTSQLDTGRQHALALDAQDQLSHLRERFAIPKSPDGEPVVYMVGNSLGLQPDSAREAITTELDDWATLAVDAHFKDSTPWFSYHELLREPAARLVGALPSEVVVMNSLTVNLHLLMVSFYRPTTTRYKIVIEDSAFPSDSYAVASQARSHGLEPSDAIIRLTPREGERTLRTEDIENSLRDNADSIALVMLGGVNYLTGQLFDIPRITACAHEIGALAGWDLAHAAGNVPLQLHDWNADFAAWCSYKYLNSGPGSCAGAFVHERHFNSQNTHIPRFEGWWGHDSETRFRMGPEFHPARGVDAWQLSNPPIFAMAPVLASLRLFDEAAMPVLRAKSLRLTDYLEQLINAIPRSPYTISTPSDPAQRGAQLSLIAPMPSKQLQQILQTKHIIADHREPNVLRVAPTPMYNSFLDVWKLASALREAAE
ncbi:MAG: kynureninase [Planctomycetota bacterium]|jgi:kynureninase